MDGNKERNSDPIKSFNYREWRGNSMTSHHKEPDGAKTKKLSTVEIRLRDMQQEKSALEQQV